MRDLVLAVIVFGLLPFMIARPVVGAYVWTWLSMMNPHRLVFGFARNLPFAQVVAIATMIGWLVAQKQRKPMPWNVVTALQLSLLLWMSFTSFFAIADGDLVLDRWVFVMKIQVMLFVTLMLIRGRQDIERLIWVMVVSIGFYGIKGGIFTLLTGGQERVWGPPGGMIEGNNELAAILVMLVPLMAYLFAVNKRRVVRIGLGLAIAAIGMSILGSQSRGAFLGLIAMAFVLAMKSKRPVTVSIALALVLVVAVAFMPDKWSDRMDTVQSYQSDTSAMSRIYTWKTLWACVLDRPLVGAGFRADSQMVFALYAPTEGEFAVFRGMVWVAHSIYFQTLGEHGFPGLILFVCLGIATWRMAARLAKQTAGDGEFGTWVPVLMRMIQVSLVGFAAGGAFLSLAYVDVPYYFVAIVVLADATVRERRKAQAVSLPADTNPTTP